MANGDALPEGLNADLARLADQRITLVIGAGCSKEYPTSLRLSHQLAQDIYERLIDDGVLPEDCCEDQSDLSSVADAVYAECESLQPLYDRMDRQQFINTTPNTGHKIAAALMREHVVASVITLNYDDAMTQAVGWVGGAEDVTEIRGPEAHRELSAVNLVYLHRKADDTDDLIIRSEDLERGWEGKWEEAIARSQLLRSSCVFAGLGSPAAVLLKSTREIKSAVGDGTTFYQVDPAEHPDEAEDASDISAFTEELNISREQYIQSKWCAFMDRAGNRVRLEQVRQLCDACWNSVEDYWPELFEDVSEDTEDDLRDRIKALFLSESDSYGLLELGKLRARWFLKSESQYYPQSSDNVAEWVSQLLLAVDFIVRNYNIDEVVFSPQDGCAILREEGGRTWVSHLAHGRSTKSWAHLSSSSSVARPPRERMIQSTLLIGAGLIGEPVELTQSPPEDITNPGEETGDGTNPRLVPWNIPDTKLDATQIHDHTERLDRVFG